MCGPSSEQQQTYQAQAAFFNQLTSAYAQQFAGQTGILKELTSVYEPILQAGPSQAGFSPQELSALNTQATEQVSQNYASLQKALAAQQGAQGGGDVFVPSGVNEAIRAQLGTSAANELGSEQNKIQLANYAAGREQFNQATQALGGVAGMQNPIGYAGQATGAGEAAGKTAGDIASADNAWMGALGGLAGGVLGGWAQGGFKIP